MMLKVSGIPPEMSTPMFRMLIQDLCNLSYVMVEDLTQKSSSSSQSTIVACPNDHTGMRVLQKLHGKIIGTCQLIVAPWMTNDSTEKYGQTALQQCESSFKSNGFSDRPPMYNFEDSGGISKKRKFCERDQGIAGSNINSPLNDSEPNFNRCYNYQQQNTNCGRNNSRQQNVHTQQDSNLCDEPVAAVSFHLPKVSLHFHNSQAYGHQENFGNVHNFLGDNRLEKNYQTTLKQCESSFNSEDFHQQPQIYNFENSVKRSNKRKFCSRDDDIADSIRKSSHKDAETNPFRDYNCQQQDPNCGSTKRQHVHTWQESNLFDQTVAAVPSPLIKVPLLKDPPPKVPLLKDPPHFQESHGSEVLGNQILYRNCNNFRQAAQGRLKVYPSVLDTITSQYVQKSSLMIPRAQTNEEVGLATEVTQTTYQTAKLVQHCQSTQNKSQSLSQCGSSNFASHSGATTQAQLNEIKTGTKASFQTKGAQNIVKPTNDLTLLHKAVSQVLFILLKSRPRIFAEEHNQVANQTYGLIVKKLRNKISDRIDHMQRLGHTSDSEKKLCKFYFEKYRDDITGHLNELGFANQTILETAKRKLTVEKMLIETPWLHPTHVCYSATNEHRKFQRRHQLDCATNFICLCVLKMPPAPTSNASMKKLQWPDQIVFDYFKVDIFKKLDEYYKLTNNKNLSWKRCASSYLLATGDEETDKSLKDAISYYEQNSAKTYKGIFMHDMKPDFSMIIDGRILRRFAVSITREIMKQNKFLIDSMKETCESADKKNYEDTLCTCIRLIVTGRMKDFIKQIKSHKITEEYWIRYRDTTNVCMMAHEQMKSGGNVNSTSEEETFTNSMDKFLSDINEMISMDGEAETTN